jgi:sugar lactone lactonase YvrE
VWVDARGGLIHELLSTNNAKWEPGRNWSLGSVVSAAIPRASGGLIALVGRDVVALSDEGDTSLFASLSSVDPAARFNDAKCDPQGRLVAGWLLEGGSRPGGLVRVDPDGTTRTLLNDVSLANGLGWSPDGETFYLVDTLQAGIDAFDYDHESGKITDRRRVVSIERGAGAPDGMAVDHEGCLWVAIMFGGEVRRYSPQGKLIDTLRTPTLTPTCCAFGGRDGREMFITSHSAPGKVSRNITDTLEITTERLEACGRDELGGALFVCRPGVYGPIDTPFAG